jgi:hypothetical protein
LKWRQARPSYSEKKIGPPGGTFGPAGCGNGIANDPQDRKFFGYFFSKK